MLRYPVEGMSCGHCAQAVTKAVQGVEPTARVAVDLDAKRVTVEYSDQTEAIASAIEQAGYSVTVS